MIYDKYFQRKYAGLEELSKERDEAVRKCKEATKEAYAEVREQVEKDLKAKDREAAQREEALAESVEAMQTALRRLETTSAAKEQRMREEVRGQDERAGSCGARGA